MPDEQLIFFVYGIGSPQLETVFEISCKVYGDFATTDVVTFIGADESCNGQSTIHFDLIQELVMEGNGDFNVVGAP